MQTQAHGAAYLTEPDAGTPETYVPGQPTSIFITYLLQTSSLAVSRGRVKA